MNKVYVEIDGVLYKAHPEDIYCLSQMNNELRRLENKLEELEHDRLDMLEELQIPENLRPDLVSAFNALAKVANNLTLNFELKCPE